MTETEAHLSRLIAQPTVSSEPNLDCIAYCEEVLTAAGARCERQFDETGAKANLWATFGPGDGDGGLVLSGHVDVVPVEGQDWSSDPFAMTERDGRLYGRGACDMKGFVACVLAAAPRFAGAARPVHVALTYDEEIGLRGARALSRMLARRGARPRLAIIGEPTDMAVIDGHKGCNEYRVTLTGREGHGSRPELGLNAALMAARVATRIAEIAAEAARDYPQDDFEPPHPTANVGVIRSGTAMNVIPAMAEVGFEMRLNRPGDDALIAGRLADWLSGTLLPEMRARHADATASLELIGESPPFAPAGDNPARDLLLRLTGANGTGRVAYCTEAGVWTSELPGLSAVVCGPGSILQAHQADEYVTRDQLARCDDLLARLAADLAA